MAKRYVELETLIRTVTATPRCDLTMALMIANNYSTADVVEVVRCKDCKYLLKDNLLKDKMICTHKDNRVFGTAKTAFANAFCSYGERR